MREYDSARPEGPPPKRMNLPEVGFTLDGQRFVCGKDLDADVLLEWSELGRAAADDVAADSPEGTAYLARFLRAAFGPQEYQRLRRHFRLHHTPGPVVMEIVAGLEEEMAAVVEEYTGRPTAPSSPSSPGPGDPGGQRSRVISLARGEVSYAEPPGRPAAQDRKAKGGRPRQRPASAG